MSVTVTPLDEERQANRLRRQLEKARRARREKARAEARNRPRRLAAVERAMDRLGREYKRLPKYPNGQERRVAIREELRDLGQRRLDLKYEV